MPVKAVGMWRRLFNYVFKPKIARRDLVFLLVIIILFMLVPSITYLLISIATLVYAIFTLNGVGALISLIMLLVSGVFTRWVFVLIDLVTTKSKTVK